MGIYSNDFQTTLGDISNPLRLSGVYGNLANSSLYSKDPTEPGLFNILGKLVDQGTDSMKDNLRDSLRDRAITPYANDLTKLTAMKDKTGDYQFLKNNMVSNLSGLEDWLLDARRDTNINNAINTVNTNEGVSWLDNYKASISGMPVNDVAHGTKNLDSLYDLAGKGRTGGEMLNVKESANRAVINQLTDMLKPEIQSAVNDAALRGEVLTPAAIINSGSTIFSDILKKLGVDPKIANNRQIIDPVRDSLFTQHNKATGTDGALKPTDVRTWETKTYNIDRLNGLVMNYTGYDANGVTSSLTDNDIKEMGFTNRDAANQRIAYLMQRKYLQDPTVLNFINKMQNNDINYKLSPEFTQVLSKAAEIDRLNGFSDNNSTITRITGQPNFVKIMETYANVLKPKSEEDNQRRAYLDTALNFYKNYQDSGKYNPLRKASLDKVTETGLNSMTTDIKSIASGEGIKTTDTQIKNALEFYAYVLERDDIKVPFRGVDKPAFTEGNIKKWNKVRDMIHMYLLATTVNSGLTK